jgi:two-component system invasion response regulator UvrY
MTKILVIEDETLFSSFIKEVIASEPDFELVGEAKTGFEGLQLEKSLKPDLIILDIHLPDISGISIAKKLRQQSPSIKILVVSASTSPIYIYNLVKLKINGYMTKGAAQIGDFIHALQVIRDEKPYFSDEAANSLAFIINQKNQEFPLIDLTPQEIEVTAQLIDGTSIKEIARKVHLSDKRIYRLRSQILKKLDVRNNVELTAQFWRYFTKS